VDYYIENYQIMIKINGKKEIFDFNSFTVVVNEVRSIMETILKFVNDKTKELENKAEEMEKKAEELGRKTLLIEQATRNKHLETVQLKQKSSKIKNEIKRLNRKTEKINKVSEIIERKKPKQSIRVISKSEEHSSLYDGVL
jgi:hypothetical protein